MLSIIMIQPPEATEHLPYYSRYTTLVKDAT